MKFGLCQLQAGSPLFRTGPHLLWTDTGFGSYSFNRITRIEKNMICYKSKSGASCSKLTKSLVNDSLKFQMAKLQIHCHFFVGKM